MGHIRMPPKEKLSPEDYRRELERGLLDLEAILYSITLYHVMSHNIM